MLRNASAWPPSDSDVGCHKRPFDPSTPREPVLRKLCTTHHTQRPASGLVHSAIFAPRAMIKEGADYGSDQTQYTGNGRRGDGDRRSAASVCSADRSWRALLRK